jgi:hypothetical protein
MAGTLLLDESKTNSEDLCFSNLNFCSWFKVGYNEVQTQLLWHEVNQEK